MSLIREPFFFFLILIGKHPIYIINWEKNHVLLLLGHKSLHLPIEQITSIVLKKRYVSKWEGGGVKQGMNECVS